MKEKVYRLVKQNTQQGKFSSNTAVALSKETNSSRNLVSQWLNTYFSEGIVVKIKQRPVCFVDKKIVEDAYGVKLDTNIYENETMLLQALQPQAKKDFQNLIGQESSLKEIVDKCKASISYPPNGLPIILYGPTGCGKSYIVRLMYEYAVNMGILKSNAKYIHVNCSEYANNPELLTANLFGYKKGAFTGADKDNVGLVKAAENGVLFLDEVHCLRPECQEKLFLFMDSGQYRMLGNNEDVFHSKVFLAFATTEIPQDVLLKTLYRRIPVRVEIPAIENRTKAEKEELVINHLQFEQEKIKYKISISRGAYEILLTAKYVGNVGELKNCIQATCMNALFHHTEGNTLEIHTLDIPENILESAQVNNKSTFVSFFVNRRELLQVDALKEKFMDINQDHFLIGTIKKQFALLKNNEIVMDAFLKQASSAMEEYYNQYLFTTKQNYSVKDNYIYSSIKEVIEMVGKQHGISLKPVGINMIIFLLQELSNTSDSNSDRVLDDFSKIVHKKYPKEYALTLEICKTISFLDLQYNSFIEAMICLSIVMYSTIQNSSDTIGVIIAHGYATASSIANAVNQLLGEYVFDSIDMELEVTTEMIVQKLNQYLEKRDTFQDLVLLVDMGSLEEIYKGISSHKNANIVIANNVSTKMALTVGAAICQNRDLEETFAEIRKNSAVNYQMLKQDSKTKVILCSCATGIGTAEKLKTILEDSLPKSLPIKVITHDYSSLTTNQLDTDLFTKYNVLCIVGTLNPNLENITFIPIEDFIVKDSFAVLTDQFKELINEEDIEEFRKKILQNFSLTNIIENLTFLNPKQLLEHVANAIDQLQVELQEEFSYNICFGLYVHVCCLIERLVAREGAEEYVKKLEDCTKEEQIFIQHIKKAFKEVEKYYHVSLPIEEISYIHIYITTLHETKDAVDE